MTARIVAWAIVLLLAVLGFKFYQSFNSPWSAPGITSVMPKVTPCSKDCL
jgi:hypothetical protein